MMNIHIGNIVCAIMDVVEVLFFYNIFLERKKMNNKTFLLCSVIASLLSVGKLYIDKPPIINLCLSLCLFIAIVMILYRGTIINRLITTAVFFIIGMLAETLAQYLIELIVGVSYNEITVDSQTLFAPLSMAIVIIILLYTKKVHKKQLADIPLKYLIPTMLTPIVSLIIILIADKIIALSDGQGEKLILPLVLMLLYVSFITFDFIESYSNKIKLDAAQEIIEKDRENYKILEENERELRALRHDIRKHMQIIRNLKDEKKDGIDKDIEGFVDDLQHTVNKITSVSYTGNEMLDSILNIKGRRAKALNIKYFVKSNISADIKIRDMDLSTILCNALDNAIEGAVNTSEASIVNYIEADDKNIKFLIENTANNVHFVDGKIGTTKRDKKNHGKGMDNIRLCVDKYDGTVTFDYDEGIFIADIKIKNIPLRNVIRD